MACRIGELALGCRDPEVPARFWCAVPDFVVPEAPGPAPKSTYVPAPGRA